MRTEQQARDLQKIQHIIETTGGDTPQPVAAKTIRYRNTAADRRVMRMIPISAIGVGGTAPGTDPLLELLLQEQRQRRRPTNV